MKLSAALKSEYVVFLTVTDMRALGPFTHVYGKLYQGPGIFEKLELEYTMTGAQAAKLNKGDEHRSYKKGDKSQRFWSVEDLHKTAISEYRTHFPKARWLLKGDNYVVSPQAVLDGPGADELNSLFTLYNMQAEDVRNLGHDPHEYYEDIEQRWENLFLRTFMEHA